MCESTCDTLTSAATNQGDNTVSVAQGGTESLCMPHWLKNSLSGKAKVWTKATIEMLVKKRLQIPSQLIEEYGLTVDVILVRLEQMNWQECHRNGSRLLNRWKRYCWMFSLRERQILDIHWHSRHPGVRQIAYFAWQVSPFKTKAAIKLVVWSCVECQSKGKLDVDTNWSQLGMDITYYGGDQSLTLIDCGPSWFAIWWPRTLLL